MSRILFLDDQECHLLREIIEAVPTCRRYMAFIAHLTDILPESAPIPLSADSLPSAPRVPESEGGFNLTAHTECGKQFMADLLNRLPHTGDL